MKDGGLLEYKCRRCGAIDRSTHAPSVLAAVSLITVTGSTGKMPGIPCSMLGAHQCPDGGIGVTDFIGGIPDGAVTRENHGEGATS
jgi:hypothetical protein